MRSGMPLTPLIREKSVDKQLNRRNTLAPCLPVQLKAIRSKLRSTILWIPRLLSWSVYEQGQQLEPKHLVRKAKYLLWILTQLTNINCPSATCAQLLPKPKFPETGCHSTMLLIMEHQNDSCLDITIKVFCVVQSYNVILTCIQG